MTLAYIFKLSIGLNVTDIYAQKINDFFFKTCEIVIVRFLIQDKVSKVQFFEKIFLLTNTNIKIVIKMFFFSFSNANIKFIEMIKFI